LSDGTFVIRISAAIEGEATPASISAPDGADPIPARVLTRTPAARSASASCRAA